MLGQKVMSGRRRLAKVVSKEEIESLLDENSTESTVKRPKLILLNEECQDADVIVDRLSNKTDVESTREGNSIPTFIGEIGSDDQRFVENLACEFSNRTPLKNNPPEKMISAMLKQQTLSQLEIRKLKTLCETRSPLKNLCDVKSNLFKKKGVVKRVIKCSRKRTAIRSSSRLRDKSIKENCDPSNEEHNRNLQSEPSSEDLSRYKSIQENCDPIDEEHNRKLQSEPSIEVLENRSKFDLLPSTEEVAPDEMEVDNAALNEDGNFGLNAEDLSLTKSLTENVETFTVELNRGNLVRVDESINQSEGQPLTGEIDEQLVLETQCSNITLSTKNNQMCSREHYQESEEEMRRLSLGTHVYIEREYGDVKHLERLVLTERIFEKVVDHLKDRSENQILPSVCPKKLMRLWENSGMINDEQVHVSSEQYCPFGHCSKVSTKGLSPIELDLIYLSPKSRKLESRSRDVSVASKQLFTSADNEHEHPVSESRDHGMNLSMSLLSPTKDKLFERNVELLKENQLLKKKISMLEKNSGSKSIVKESEDTNNQEELGKNECYVCSKVLATAFSLGLHLRKVHKITDKVDTEVKCPLCGKCVKNIDKHNKAKHADKCDRVCPKCNERIDTNLKVHLGKCRYKCQVCGDSFIRKDRFRDHVCKGKQASSQSVEKAQLASNSEIISRESEMSQPLTSEKTSTTVGNGMNISKTIGSDGIVCLNDGQVEFDSYEWSGLKDPMSNDRSTCETTAENCLNEVDVCDENTGHNCTETDNESTDDGYCTEYEENDPPSFTELRRKNKKELELDLKAIDKLPSRSGEDAVFVAQFREYLDEILNSDVEKGDFDKVQKVQTVNKYVSSISRELLPILYEYAHPFNSNWLLDCSTEKNFTCDGIQRQTEDLKDPFFISVRVVRLFMNRYDGYVFGQKKADFLAALHHLMKFIEYHFGSDPNRYGRDVLLKVISNHSLVKSYIESTGIWKRVNKERKKSSQKNAVLKDLQKPNEDVKVLRRSKGYIKSDKRVQSLQEFCAYADPNNRKPSAKEFNDCTNFLMGEIVMTTGCRPVVLYRLKNEDYANKDMGFNPYKIYFGDAIETDEEKNGDKIPRRVNPSLPSRSLACSHQIESESAVCPVGCENACPPDGFNIRD